VIDELPPMIPRPSFATRLANMTMYVCMLGAGVSFWIGVGLVCDRLLAR